jgi:hypothetical protein
VLVALVLVAALACLCVGLLLSSTPWLAASVAASVVAGVLIHRHRAALRTAGAPDSAQPSATDDPDVWVIDGRPRYHRRTCEIIDGHGAEAIPRSQANEDGFIPCSLCQPET